jgi:4-carboxymuconolactone decarboxylase
MSSVLAHGDVSLRASSHAPPPASVYHTTPAAHVAPRVHFKGSAMNKELFDKGLAIRKSVIGTEFVEKALASADDFNMPLQELVTEYCWGAVWGREGLEKKTRSLLNIAMLSTLNRPHELKVHVKGAIRNGATKTEIREVLLQVAIYAGVPAAVDSFRVAKEALVELEKK